MRFLSLLVFACAVFLLPVSGVFAQNPDLSPEERSKLEKQLADLERQIVQTQNTINTLSSEGELEIRQLSNGIVLHGETIESLSEKIAKEQASLAQILRKTQEIDDYSLVEAVFSAEDMSNFFSDLDSFASIKEALQISFEQLRAARAQTSDEKTALEGERTDQQILREALVAEQREVEVKEAEKQELLAETKGQEELYRKLKSVQEQTAAQIRARLFPLRDTEGIQFGTAVTYAKAASQKTGVRAALILAILSQESDLGKNVGQCLITDIATGDGKGKNTGTPFPGTMKVPRDTVPFERLMAAAGRDWRTTPVSCPLPGGYGGAMGPTQFIPSTWEMYEGRIKSALGVSAADPWNAEHAITATALYLADVGATGGSYLAEHTAAARYYAGGNWATSGQSYGNQVMQKATQFQKDIDFLSAN